MNEDTAICLARTGKELEPVYRFRYLPGKVNGYSSSLETCKESGSFTMSAAIPSSRLLETGEVTRARTKEAYAP